MKKIKSDYNPKDYFPWVSDFFDNIASSSREDRRIVKRLRERHNEMKEVYFEIYNKMSNLHIPVNIIPERRTFPVLFAIIDAAVLYDPNTEWPQREIKKQLDEARYEIIENTLKLIESLDKYSKIETRGRVITDAFFDIFHLIEESGKKVFLFESHIAPILNHIHSYSGKYYPGLSDVLQALILEVESNEVVAMSPEDNSVLKYQKPSQADFIRFFSERLDREKESRSISTEFHLSHKAIAIITACALGLEEVSESTVSKALRNISGK